jgi:beta-glucosidase
MVGKEARSRRFNIQLAGGLDLARDPRNGRTFEYLSEDPLLTAVLAAEAGPQALRGGRAGPVPNTSERADR